jgi:hypothetical protein
MLTPRRIILLITIGMLVWLALVVATAGFVRADELAQLITAITTVFYSGVFAFGYYMMIKGNQQTLKEMREERLSGGRPEVIVEARYSRFPKVDLAVRNLTGGVAKDITFDFSAPIEDSTGFVLSELPYFREGMTFLGPGEEIACTWDDFDPLIASLRKKGLNKGVTVTLGYKDLGGEHYETAWQINPLLYAGTRFIPGEERHGLLARAPA